MFSTLPQGLEFCLAVLSILLNIETGINLAITFSGSLQNRKLPSETMRLYIKVGEKKNISFNHKNTTQKNVSQHVHPIKGSNPGSSRTERVDTNENCNEIYYD